MIKIPSTESIMRENGILAEQIMMGANDVSMVTSYEK